MESLIDDPLGSGLLLAGGLILVALLVWLQRSRNETAPRHPDRSGTRLGRPRTLDDVDTVMGWPPQATRVLTLRHQRGMEVLRRAMPGHLILAQVPLSHFLKVPTRLSYVEWMRRVGHVCVDLMVCDAASNVIAIIEVRQADKIESERARKRHQRVERVLRAAGIPLHVWNEALMPDPVAVRRALLPEDQEAERHVSDTGPDTHPLGQSGLRRPPKRDLEPPGSTWFDELHATQPLRLDDGVKVTMSGPRPAPQQPAAVAGRPGPALPSR
ncbi:MAG: hypothetical protein QG612_352 [Pseudomonadota bacterium]|nr:hypothetical protein [Pseudomonadota bacterium]